ncbi:MAG: undecaprenyl-diphosphate phosphatase [Bacteroidia bacterium]|nr:undecaprenyl-diphosphate phosphatase [Bacteroidia bacterium]
MIEVIKVFLLSVIQGITEWLPVSSTGHMILLDDILKLQVSDEFWSLFLVVVQLGSILAVVYIFFNKLNPFSRQKTKTQQAQTWMLWKKVLVATIPAVIIGLALENFMEILNNSWVVAAALIIYGVIFIVIENYQAKSKKPAKISQLEDITYADAAKIGVFQILPLIPGTSRSGSTIIGGLLMGASREVATEFSFFMGIPVMFGASFLKLIKYGYNYSGSEIFYLIFGMVTAFIVSVFAIKFLLNYIKNNDFKPFGYYRIILGGLVITLALLR